MVALSGNGRLAMSDGLIGILGDIQRLAVVTQASRLESWGSLNLAFGTWDSWSSAARAQIQNPKPQIQGRHKVQGFLDTGATYDSYGSARMDGVIDLCTSASPSTCSGPDHSTPLRVILSLSNG